MVLTAARPSRRPARRRTPAARIRWRARLAALVVAAAVLPVAPAAARHLPDVARTGPTPQASTSWTASTTRPAAPPAAGSSAGPGSGSWTPEPAAGAWPLSPRPDVVSGFDPPDSRWGAGHRGVDLAGSVGQLVQAAQAGTVSFAGRIAGRGVVVVTHGATRTTYEPVTATVEVGDQVGAGDPIGRLELLGSHCLPRACLHWGLVQGRTYLDPLTLVGAGRVRLLPW